MQSGGRSEVALSQVATADLDVAVLSQPPPPHLPLGDQFEAGSMQIVGFQATLRRCAFREQTLEYASWNPNHALIVADADAELDHGPFGVPPGILWKAEKHCDLRG